MNIVYSQSRSLLQVNLICSVDAGSPSNKTCSLLTPVCILPLMIVMSTTGPIATQFFFYSRENALTPIMLIFLCKFRSNRNTGKLVSHVILHCEQATQGVHMCDTSLDEWNIVTMAVANGLRAYFLLLIGIMVFKLNRNQLAIQHRVKQVLNLLK